MKSNFLILLYLFSVLFSIAVADEIKLFDADGNQVANYDELLKNLKPGDELIFNNGEYRYQYEEVLGNGKQSKILQVKPLAPPTGESLAIRLPLSNGLYKGSVPYPVFITEFKQGAESLRNNDIRIPKIYHSYADQFVTVELVKPDFDISNFLSNDKIASPEVMKEAEDALYKFAKSTSPYAQIGDFHDKQLIYDSSRKEWILLDFIDTHKEFKPFTLRGRMNHPFYKIFYDYWGQEKFKTERAREILSNIRIEISTGDWSARGKCLKNSIRSLLNPLKWRQPQPQI